MALVAGAAALVVQTWAQARLAPTRAAVIMTMEPVWAGVFAVLLGGEVAHRPGAGRRRDRAGRHVPGRARARGSGEVAEEVGGVAARRAGLDGRPAP